MNSIVQMAVKEKAVGNIPRLVPGREKPLDYGKGTALSMESILPLASEMSVPSHGGTRDNG